MRHLASFALAVVACVSSGCSKKEAPGDSLQAVSAASIIVDVDGFKPSKVKLKKGAPATLTFTRTTDDTCATEVVFPQLNIKKELPKDKPVAIEIPTDKEQTLTFQCGMGMYKSSVIVAPN